MIRHLWARLTAETLPWQQTGPQSWRCGPYQVFPLPYDEGFVMKARDTTIGLSYSDHTARRDLEVYHHMNWRKFT